MKKPLLIVLSVIIPIQDRWRFSNALRGIAPSLTQVQKVFNTTSKSVILAFVIGVGLTFTV